MLPYLLVLSFVMFWIMLEQKVLNRKSFWLPLMFLALLPGMRSTAVGVDSGNYARKFAARSDIQNLSFDEGIEKGYQVLEYILSRLTGQYFLLFFITGLIVVYCHLRIIKKYSVNYGLSIFLFFTLGSYTFFFNGLRQGMAMAICVLTMPYLLQRKFIPYLLICCLASLFHVTALFAIPFYFIVNLRIKLLYRILITFLVSLLSSRFLVSYLSSSNERYEDYGKVSEQAGGLVTLGFYTIIMILIYVFIHTYKFKEEKFIRLYTLYATGVMFIIPIAMLGANPSGPQRLLNYFIWPLIFLIPVILKRINNIYFYIITIIFSLTYFILATGRLAQLSPYIINPIFEIF